MKIGQIEQLDNHTFKIVWSDKLVSLYRLSDLQRKCPCAGCNDELIGKRIVEEESIKEDVKAKRIASVGNYAIKIEFTSGCSSGIYSFEFLRNLMK